MEDIIDIIVTETTNLIEITSQPTDEVIDVNIIDNREDITLNVTPSVVEININSLTGNFGVEWGDITGTLSNQTDLNTALSLKADLVDGKVPSSQLPSYVDDVVEVANYASLPATGEVGKIYITLDTNFIYRWTGSTYVEIKDSSAVWGAITGTLSNQTDLQSALNAKQNQLNGTGFVKASGTTISYDNSTYLKGSLSDGFIPYWSSSLGALTNSFIEKFGNFTQIGGSGLDVFNGMTVSGRYDNVANAPKIFSSDESTGMAHISFINSGGGFNLGVNKSTANGLMGGASAYATVLTSLQATNLEFGTDATKRLTISGTTGAATFTSSVTSTNFVLSGGTGNTGLYFGHTDKVVLANYVTGGGLDFETNGGNITMQLSSAGNLSAVGTITGSSIIKSGGTSSQFLKADGSVDSSTYALDSAVVHNTGNETVAGQKTFSSTLYGASAVFSSAVNVQSINVTGITASPSVYITTNGTNHAVSIVQSGAGYAIYASGNVAVIGTGYFSSSLTAASLASTAGYNYTLPSASGTLALTSNLSSYLPLAGGTLSGALSGTTGSFTNSSGDTFVLSKSSGPSLKFSKTASTAQDWALAGEGSAFKLYNYTAGTTPFQIETTGAATFSSSVTAVGTMFLQRASNGATTTFQFKNEIGADRAKITFGGTNEELSFYAGGGSSEHMRITSAGNVGIGTTAPNKNLHIKSTNGNATAQLQLESTGTVKGYMGVFSDTVYINSGGTYNSGWSLDGSFGVASIELNSFNGGSTLLFATANSNSTPTERMRITSSGDLLVGKTALGWTVAGFQVEQAGKIVGVTSGSSAENLFLNRNSSNTGNFIAFFYNNGNVGSISTNGSSTSYNTSSDYRLKQDLKAINGLDLVNRINVYNYEWKSDKTRMDGVIAHELQEILPYAVTGVKDGAEMQSVDYSKIVPVMVQAIKELKAELDTLKNK